MSNHIETIDELKHYLYLAMQLEHATIPPYLLALYSIKPDTTTDPVTQLIEAKNAAATQVLRVVVVEEMLHLTLAANVLNAVGGTPELTKQGFVPLYPALLPDGETDFKVDLQPFSTAAINTFLKIERPSELPDERKVANNRMTSRERRPESALLYAPKGDGNVTYWSIGEFYTAIADGLKFLYEIHGPGLFSGDPSRQVPPEAFFSGGGSCIPVTDLASALRAVELIIEQGEGYDVGIYGSEGELAHEYRFDQLKHGRYYQPYGYDPQDKPQHPTGPELKVDWSAAYQFKVNARLADYKENPALYAAAADFNTSYAEFLAFLNEAFNGKPDLLIPDPNDPEKVTAIPLMFEIRNKITELIRVPIRGADGVTASPTFELYNN